MIKPDLFTIAQALLSGACVTIEVAAGSLVLAITLGLFLASVRFLIRSLILHAIVSTYVEIFRNVPSLTYLFLVYFGLAYLGVRLPSLAAAIIGLGLIGGAVLTDIFRAGFQAIAAGQREAALSIGLTPLMAFRLIVLPQAWRICLPPLGNYAIGLVKDTSLVGAIAAPEIMFNARQIVNQTFQTTLVYGGAAAIYLLITFAISKSVGHLEQKAAYQ